MRFLIWCLCACLLFGCATTKPQRRGGSAGTNPYTIKGKTYYPLKSADGFVEEGIASWYGPGFHGKTTANGEIYNQYAMTAAHKILPLGTQVRVTRLDTGRSLLVRINDRGPFVEDRVIDLSKAAATRLGMMGSGTAKVRVQSVGPVREAATGTIKGNFYVQAGAFGSKENAQKFIQALIRDGHRGRLIYGNNNMWNVQVGPQKDSAAAQTLLSRLKSSYPRAFVVAGQ